MDHQARGIPDPEARAWLAARRVHLDAPLDWDWNWRAHASASREAWHTQRTAHPACAGVADGPLKIDAGSLPDDPRRVNAV